MKANNDRNYPGAQIDNLVGNVGADPAYPAYDKEGKRGYKEIRIAVSQGYKDKDGNWVEQPSAWYTYSIHEDQVAALGVGKGDKVRIDDAKLETREFERKDGSQGLGLNLRFGTLEVLESRSGGSARQTDDEDAF